MNKQKFNQSGGFPIKTQMLDAMQTAYSLFNSLGDLAGNFAIISGCETIGSIVSDGLVYIHNELLEFRGGQIGASVIIVEQVIQKEFKDGNNRDVVFVRYATFGIGATTYPWSNFKRPKNSLELTQQKAEQTTIDALITRIKDLEARPSANVPKGMIAIWDRPANEIPVGWVEYHNLRGRMPIGLDEADAELDALGTAGGAKNKTLSIEEMPKHRHGVGPYGGVGTGIKAEPWEDNNGAGDYTDYMGNDKAFSLLNPYRVVHFIKYIG